MKQRIATLVSTFLLTVALLAPTLAIITPSPWQPVASAHGGVIIDGGFTDHYEWIAMASPFPVTPGETIVTILIYDIETYAPINGLAPILELSPPGEPRPCCTGDQTLGPLPLLVDPILYPGDYSNIALLLREGAWQGKFTILEEDPVGPGELTEILFEIDIREAEAGAVRETPIDAPSIAQTATVAAQVFAEGDSQSSNEGSETENSEADGEAAYPEPVEAIAPNDAANDDADGQSSAQETSPDEAGAISTPYPPPSSEEAAAAEESTGNDGESTAESSTAGGEGAGQAETGSQASDQSTANESTPEQQGSEQPVSEQTEPAQESASWASQNLWLLAALALIPLLLVIVWLLISSNKEEEWTGDPEE